MPLLSEEAGTAPVVDPSPAGGVLALLWVVIALPAVGAAVILLLGNNCTRGWAHLLGCATVLGSFVLSVLTFVALLGRAHPVGIMLAALLFGAMRAGSGLMQIEAGIPPEIIDVIQATILLFLAADVVIRRALHIRAPSAEPEELQTVSKSYGSGTPA